MDAGKRKMGRMRNGANRGKESEAALESLDGGRVLQKIAILIACAPCVHAVPHPMKDRKNPERLVFHGSTRTSFTVSRAGRPEEKSIKIAATAP